MHTTQHPNAETGAAVLSTDARLESIERVCAAWTRDSEELAAATDATVARSGIPHSEVHQQLVRVCAGFTAAALRSALDDQLGDWRLLDAAGDGGQAPAVIPNEVLHLVAGGVPGLLIESCLWGIAIGARNQCRPSRDDAAFTPFLQLLVAQTPDLAPYVELIDVPRFETADAAVVYGSDATVDMVRQRLGGDAPIAAFGTRSGVAVLRADRLADGAWPALLADDIVRFRQRGCMSPRTVFVIAAETGTGIDTVRTRLGSELAAVAPAARVDVVDDDDHVFAQRLLTRSAIDEQALAHHESLSAQDQSADIAVDLVAVTDIDQLVAVLEHHGTRLQTAVVQAPDHDVDGLADALMAAGCTRVCRPGEAHIPPFSWPHDGIGHARALVRIRSL